MLKHVTVVNGNKPEHFISLFNKVAQENKIISDHIDTRDCIISIGYESSPVAIINNNTAIKTEDAGFLIKRTGSDIYRTYLICKILERQSTLFVDEANILSDKSADKITTMVTLPLSGISVPNTIITSTKSYELNRDYIVAHINFPVVIKKTGSKGKNVWKVNNEEELIEKIQQDKELSLIQEFIPNDYDLRVLVLDGEIVTSIKRTSADGFYNNVSQGGAAIFEEISSQEKETCIEAASISKLRLAGVDMVRTPDGPLIFEVNKAPQLDIFSPAAGFDIERDYIERAIRALTLASK